MEDLSRSEYPGMLTHLTPAHAVHLLQERSRRIGKINTEVADWLQERRKVEEQYVAGLKKLMTVKAPNGASELGVFQPSWEAILRSVESIANSHHLFSQRIEKDVESPLRGFQNKKEYASMSTIAGNLQSVARELEDAKDKAEKLSKKGGKASAHKVDAATSRLESATQQWESQAPFVFEQLQALDEQRVNHMRDVLTQLETHEVDQATRNQATAESMLNLILEVKTEDEIQSFVHRATAGRAKIEHRRTNTRQSSIAGSVSAPHTPSQTATAAAHPPLPPVPPQHQSSLSHDDDMSEHSGRNEPQQENKLRSRIGTMLGRRRQSIHGGFGPLSPPKNNGPFNRASVSSHGRAVSPRASSHNLTETNHRLSSLAETPDSPQPPTTADRANASREGVTNGFSSGGAAAAGSGAANNISALNGLTADEIFGVPPPPGPPPSHQKTASETASEPTKDADGFTVPSRGNDPISQAQREATAVGGEAFGGEEGEHAFKLNIQNEPIAEEDATAKQAALSNVANTLSLAMPTRRGGTVRGRRDVRNTIYVPAPSVPEMPSSISPSLPKSPASRPSAVAALTSEASLAGTSDSQSVRSATSLGSLAHFKHPDMGEPGLNSSIVETVSASFEDGELKWTKIAGEIAFSYNPTADHPAEETETIRINNFPLLEVIGPNRIFVQNTTAADEFTLNTAHLQGHKATIGFTFRVHAEDATSLAGHCPLVMKAAWKPQGDKLGLVLQYRLHPASHLTGPVTLHNVVFIATYTGARASGAQTKPTGTHLKDKHLVYWRVGEVTLTEAWAKIICRVVGEQGASPQPGHIEARWDCAASSVESGGGGAGTISVSQLQRAEGKGKGKEVEEDPFADETLSPGPTEGQWRAVPLVRQIVSGRYEAK